MSVEELVKNLKSIGTYDETELWEIIEEAADKLEELAAENERVRRDRVEANNEWRKAYNDLTVKTEAALAEKDKEIADLREELSETVIELLYG